MYQHLRMKLPGRRVVLAKSLMTKGSCEVHSREWESVSDRVMLFRFQVIIRTVMQIGPAMSTYGAILFVSLEVLRI